MSRRRQETAAATEVLIRIPCSSAGMVGQEGIVSGPRHACWRLGLGEVT